MPTEVEVVGDRLQVGQDLRLVGVRAAPRPIRGERERIQVALDVAGRARIHVLPPGAADTIGTLDDQQVVDAFAPQRHRGGESAESGADDDHSWRMAVSQTPAPGRRYCGAGHCEVPRVNCRIPPVSRGPGSLEMSAYSVGVPKEAALPSLRVRLPFPVVVAGRKSAIASQGAACFDCHANGHQNGTTHLAPDARPEWFRHRIKTVSLRGVDIQRLFGRSEL